MKKAGETTREVLRGTLDSQNPLSMLRGNALVWENILGHVDAFYEAHIDRSDRAWRIISPCMQRPQEVKFPKPTGLCINMMPISLWDINTIPAQCLQYGEMIQACPAPYWDIHSQGRSDHVVYLTVCESLVQVGESQRRPGLHIERPGEIQNGGRLLEDASDPMFKQIAWGLGCFGGTGIPTDGIFMASNVADSCKVYSELIINPEEVTNARGGIEHMRNRLGPGTSLKANQLVWFTDRTPHESMPVTSADGQTSVYRQFFRLVVGRISVWYSLYNTPNPSGFGPRVPISDADPWA